MPYSKEAVGRRLKSIRVDRNMDQEELANAAKCSKNSVARYETAKNGMSLQVAFNLTEALDCSLEALVGRESI